MIIIIFMKVISVNHLYHCGGEEREIYSDLIKVAEAFKVIDVTIVIEMSFDL